MQLLLKNFISQNILLFYDFNNKINKNEHTIEHTILNFLFLLEFN